MIIPALLLQATVADAGAQCRRLSLSDPAAAERLSGQLPLASSADGLACRGDALARQARWMEAGRAFDDAARRAEASRDTRAATYRVQAGNAFLAGGDAAAAIGALDVALATGALAGAAKGEAYLDRARAHVAAGQLAPARADIDSALPVAGEDPLAWLLSATLARRMGDLPRARTDIAAALRLSPDDAAVRLEEGNVAALGGDVDAAQAAWREAMRLAPEAPAGRSAAKALEQFQR